MFSTLDQQTGDALNVKTLIMREGHSVTGAKCPGRNDIKQIIIKNKRFQPIIYFSINSNFIFNFKKLNRELT
jgi:hypothetical protein